MIDRLRNLAIALALIALLAYEQWVGPVLQVEGFEGQMAFWQYLAVLVISFFISAALAPKTKPPKPQKGTLPDVKDGKRAVRVFGTVWIEDPIQLAMKQTGEDAIRKKGGKK